jgi:uncharacterized protein (TIGR03435 family)
MKPITALLLILALQSPPQFEVASIKPHNAPGLTMIQTPPNGLVNIVNATLRMMVRSAYRLKDYQIIGGPDWINSDRFDVQARPPAEFQPPQAGPPCVALDCTATPVQLMLQGLLVDRFQLRTHRETRELPIYELTIAKGGFKLKEVAPPPPGPPALPPPPRPPAPGTPPPTAASALPTPPPGMIMGIGTGLAGSAVQLSALAAQLSELLGRPVVDRTGLRGYYDFKIVYSRDGLPDNGQVSGLPPGGPDAGFATDPLPSIFTAVQELGMKLDSTKGQLPVVIIESASKPTEN